MSDPHLPSLHEEVNAFHELSQRASTYHFPGAKDFLIHHGGPEAPKILKEMTLGSRKPRRHRRRGEKEFVVCLLFRGGSLRFPDNKLSACTGCQLRIEHRPAIPAGVQRLCAFCALNRAMGH